MCVKRMVHCRNKDLCQKVWWHRFKYRPHTIHSKISWISRISIGTWRSWTTCSLQASYDYANLSSYDTVSRGPEKQDSAFRYALTRTLHKTLWKEPLKLSPSPFAQTTSLGMKSLSNLLFCSSLQFSTAMWAMLRLIWFYSYKKK